MVGGKEMRILARRGGGRSKAQGGNDEGGDRGAGALEEGIGMAGFTVGVACFGGNGHEKAGGWPKRAWRRTGKLLRTCTRKMAEEIAVVRSFESATVADGCERGERKKKSRRKKGVTGGARMVVGEGERGRG